MLFALLITANFFHSSSIAQADLIRVQTPPLSLTRPANALEWINHTPPFYFYQNDPAIPSEYFVTPPSQTTLPNGMIRYTTGVTNLCLPTAVATVLIDQKWFKGNPANTLKIPGLSQDQTTIDPVKILSTIVEHTGFFSRDNKGSRYKITAQQSVDKKLDIGEVYLTAAAYYRASELPQARIEITSETISDQPSHLITVNHAAGTLDEIITALKNDQQIIITVRNSHGTHELNVWGYLKANDGSYQLYITDPTANYHGPQYANPKNFETISVDTTVSPALLKGFMNRNLVSGAELHSVYTLKAN